MRKEKRTLRRRAEARTRFVSTAKKARDKKGHKRSKREAEVVTLGMSTKGMERYKVELTVSRTRCYSATER